MCVCVYTCKKDSKSLTIQCQDCIYFTHNHLHPLLKGEKLEAQKACDLPTVNQKFLNSDSLGHSAESQYASLSSRGHQKLGNVMAWLLRGRGGCRDIPLALLWASIPPAWKTSGRLPSLVPVPLIKWSKAETLLEKLAEWRSISHK